MPVSKGPEEALGPAPASLGTSKGLAEEHGAAQHSVSRGSGRPAPPYPGSRGRPPTVTPGRPDLTPRLPLWGLLEAPSGWVHAAPNWRGWRVASWGLGYNPGHLMSTQF